MLPTTITINSEENQDETLRQPPFPIV